MERSGGASSSRPSPWADPPAFLVDLLVEQLVRSELRSHAVASLRLINSNWLAAASAAVRALAARCNDAPAQRTGSIFPRLEVLQLSEVCAPFDAVDGLSGTLKCLRLLGSHNTGSDSPVHIHPPRALAVLTQLTGLVDFELEASWSTCCHAAGYLTGLPRLRSLTLTPMASWGNFSREHKVLLERCGQLSGLRRLACAADNAQPQHVEALTALQHLTALQLTKLPQEALPALVQLGSRLRSLSLLSEAELRSCSDDLLDWDGDSEECACTALPASAFSQLQHLEASWELLLAILLPQPRAAAIPPGTLNSLTSLVVDMGTSNLDYLDEDEHEEVSAMERRMELLPRWLFSTPTRLQHLRLHGATTFGGWPGRMLERVSRLRALETASFEFMHIDDGVVASLARLPRLRELELGMEEGACWPWVAPLRSCTALTRLALVVRDSCSRQQVASQVAQLRHLRSLKLDGASVNRIMTRSALQHILTALPALELLQTEWEPFSSNDEDFCKRFERRLLHSQFWDTCGPHWLHRYSPANFSATSALADVAALLAE